MQPELVDPPSFCKAELWKGAGSGQSWRQVAVRLPFLQALDLRLYSKLVHDKQSSAKQALWCTFTLGLHHRQERCASCYSPNFYILSVRSVGQCGFYLACSIHYFAEFVKWEYVATSFYIASIYTCYTPIFIRENTVLIVKVIGLDRTILA
jgi:hypothetical protein